MSIASEWVEIDKIEPWERNPRMNDHVVQQLAVSIQTYGFLNPIIVQKSTNKIIAGHTRYKAATLLNLPTVPVIFADLDDTKAKAFAIADNKLGELATWDESVLMDLLTELKEEDYDLSHMGYDELELEGLFGETTWEDLSSNVDPDNDMEVLGKAKIVIEVSYEEEESVRNLLTEVLSTYEHTIK